MAKIEGSLVLRGNDALRVLMAKTSVGETVSYRLKLTVTSLYLNEDSLGGGFVPSTTAVSMAFKVEEVNE